MVLIAKADEDQLKKKNNGYFYNSILIFCCSIRCSEKQGGMGFKNQNKKNVEILYVKSSLSVFF